MHIVISFRGRVISEHDGFEAEMILSKDSKGKPDGGKAGVVRRMMLFKRKYARVHFTDQEILDSRLGELRADLGMYLDNIRSVSFEVIE